MPGNVLVASLSSGALEVFDPHGYFLRSSRLRNCAAPSHILIEEGREGGGELYVTDFKNRVVLHYRKA